MKIRDRIKSLRRVKAKDLIPNPKNWRKHPESQQNAMRGVLAEVGWADAALVRETPEGLMLIDGHLRAEVDPEGKIPVLVLNVDEAEADLILATHDPLTAMAEASQQELGTLLAGLSLEHDGLQSMLDALAKENDIDLAELAGEELQEAEVDIDRADELREKWGTERDQLWVIEGKQTHRLLCGDNLTADIPGDIRVLVTDPPYGINWNPDHRRFTDTKTQHTSVVGDDNPFDPTPWLNYQHAVLWGANCFSDRLPLGTWLVWDKRFDNGKAFLADAECAWMRGGYGVYLYAETHQGFVGQEVRGHPTQKSSKLMAWCIKKVGGEDTILDPFLGSGTTMVAAEQLNRRCYGIEIEPKYVAVSLERMQTLGCECKVE